ncbi:protein FAM183A [Kryptolebias marmoratus]|uniref:protein FAM183A n=1 Tax=Kryptolebias marmoratus TaxID=37003 RepID=UPI0007F9353B|nr:protein FAM183A [Kryptolebias marmoratus]
MSKKENVDYVRENMIHAEMIKKERRLLMLHTEFSISPFRKLHILPDMPMSRKPADLTEEDSGFIKAYRRAHMEPTKKYPCAVTESQEIGWFSAPLNPPAFHDPRLNFRRVTTHVTKYATFTQQASNTTK